MNHEKGYLNDIEYTSTPPRKARKRKLHLLRILILVVVFCGAVFGTIVLSDVIFGKDDATSREPEIIVVTVSGENIVINNKEQVLLSQLKAYFDTMEEAGDLFAVALINDTEKPADYLVYNSIVDLLSEYDIICEKMPKPASYDEISPSTPDENFSP